MSTPYLSLGVMCGDVHAGEPLARLLRSVIERTSGQPLVDEIVIGWNGTKDHEFRVVLNDLGYLITNDAKFIVETHHADSKLPPVKVIPFPWPGRFDVARNTYWSHLQGEWLMWLDADDVVADPGVPADLAAIERIERDYGIVGPPPSPNDAPGPTLKEWLAALPPKINTVFAAYDYTIDANGYVLERQKMKRIVRRAAGHLWYSPAESGIHEVLTPLGALGEVCVDNFGLLVRHHPSQTDVERSMRNKVIVEKMTTDIAPLNLDSRHAYDVSNAQFVAGDWDKADASIKAAIQGARNDMDTYTYRLARAFLCATRGNPEGAIQEAFSAMAVLPDLRDAYLIAAEGWFRLGKWAAVVEWYERGMAKTPTLLNRDQPLSRFVAPRAQAAQAYLFLGRTAEGLKLAAEAFAEYPNNPLAREVFERATQSNNTALLHKALLDSVELMMEDDVDFAFTILQQLPDSVATRGLERGLRARQLKAKCDRVMQADVYTEHREEGVITSIDFGGLGHRADLETPFRHKSVANIIGVEKLDERRVKARVKGLSKADVAFYSPHGVSYWAPSHLEWQGLGGSESSVAHLARELSKLKYRVSTYTLRQPGQSMDLWQGVDDGKEFCVIQRNVDEFQLSDVKAFQRIVACRAPYLAREWAVGNGNRAKLLCWHQDNGYGNPWLWSETTANAQQHLHVSDWAKAGLLKEALGDASSKPTSTGHYTLGNGVSPSCGLWDPALRNPKRVIYASDPSRGLEKLLAAWPDVRREVPDAELHVMCSWLVMLTLNQSEPGAPMAHRMMKVQEQLDTLKAQGVVSYGWLPQHRVIELMKTSAIYCYPGGPMPEGFGVSLVQAEACGCDVLAPKEGALPEVLAHGYDGRWLYRGGDDDLAYKLIRFLTNPTTDERRREASSVVIGQHGWPVVAKRFLELTGLD